MQLRGRRRIDGVGRPEFDFYTGLRAGGGRLAEDSAFILTNRSHPTALRRASVMERALHFTAAVQAVGASERDGAGAGLCE